MSEGVFYAAEDVETAVSELAFHRLLFFAESPATPWPANPAEYSAFSVAFITARGVDLTRPPLDADRMNWRQLSNYIPCQDLADAARAASIEAIRYQSVRNPKQSFNIALLRCRVFSDPRPIGLQTWHVYLHSNGIQAICEFPKMSVSFARDAFAEDPRIAETDWER